MIYKVWRIKLILSLRQDEYVIPFSEFQSRKVKCQWNKETLERNESNEKNAKAGWSSRLYDVLFISQNESIFTEHQWAISTLGPLPFHLHWMKECVSILIVTNNDEEIYILCWWNNMRHFICFYHLKYTLGCNSLINSTNLKFRIRIHYIYPIFFVMTYNDLWI